MKRLPLHRTSTFDPSAPPGALRKANGHPSRWMALVGAFWNGATRPSLAALSGTLLVTGGLFVLALVFVTPTLMASHDPGCFMASPRDDYAYLSSLTLRLSQSSSSGPAVVLIGASASREACSDMESLRRILTERFGRQVDVFLLTAPNLTHWESEAVVEKIAGRIRGVVVIEIGPGKLALPSSFLGELAANPRVALDCQGLDADLREAGLTMPAHSSNFFLDNYKFFVARPSVLLNLVRKPDEPLHHQSADWRPLTEDQWGKVYERLNADFDKYMIHREANFRVYARMVRRLQESPSVTIAFHESTRNPRVTAAVKANAKTRAVLDAYDADIGKFVQEYGIHYWDLVIDAELKPDDFVDAYHLQRVEGIRHYTEILGQRLLPLLREAEKKEESP